MKAIERLYAYFELKSIKPTAFEKAVGLSNGYLGTQRKRNADMGEAVILKIINYCRDISLVWLITGEGEMLSTSTHTQLISEEFVYKSDPKDAEIIASYKEIIDTQKKLIHSLEQRLKESERGRSRSTPPSFRSVHSADSTGEHKE